MRRYIYEPAEGESIPDARATIVYTLPIANVSVVDVLVDSPLITAGTIHYDSTVLFPAVLDGNGNIIIPAIHTVDLQEPFIHHFAGWENI